MDKIKTAIKLCLPAILVFASVLSQFTQVSADCITASNTDCGSDMPYYVVMGGDVVQGNNFESNRTPGCGYVDKSLST